MGDGAQTPAHGLEDDQLIRTKTLDLLNSYIQRQRTLLERIKSDISNLQLHNQRTEQDNHNAVTRSFHDNPFPDDRDRYPHVETFSSLVRDVREGDSDLLSSIDWSMFNGRDPTPLCNLASKARMEDPLRVLPPAEVYPSSSHCDSTLRRLVREQRLLIIEPALKLATEVLSSFPPDLDQDAQTPRNAKGNTKVKHGKHTNRRRHDHGATIARPRGPGGVFIKRSVAEAQASQQHLSSSATPSSNNTTVNSQEESGRGKRKRRPSSRLLDGASEGSASRSPSLAPPTPAIAAPRLTIRIPPRFFQASRQPSRTSRVSGNSERRSTSPSSTIKSASRSASHSHGTEEVFGEYDFMDQDTERDVESGEEDQMSSHDHSESLSRVPSETPQTDSLPHIFHPEQPESNDRLDYDIASHHRQICHTESFVHVKEESFPVSSNTLGTPTNDASNTSDEPQRNETYKQAWSVSEQHLLEKLLEDYPEGVRNRWSMISKAMDGRRTPRQVASRVQKYFAKLKKFGVNISGK